MVDLDGKGVKLKVLIKNWLDKNIKEILTGKLT